MSLETRMLNIVRTVKVIPNTKGKYKAALKRLCKKHLVRKTNRGYEPVAVI